MGLRVLLQPAALSLPGTVSLAGLSPHAHALWPGGLDQLQCPVPGARRDDCGLKLSLHLVSLDFSLTTGMLVINLEGGNFKDMVETTNKDKDTK